MWFKENKTSSCVQIVQQVKQIFIIQLLKESTYGTKGELPKAVEKGKWETEKQMSEQDIEKTGIWEKRARLISWTSLQTTLLRRLGFIFKSGKYLDQDETWYLANLPHIHPPTDPSYLCF